MPALKVRTLTIGIAAHRIPWGAYRTFCGRSVELENRRKAIEVCQDCVDAEPIWWDHAWAGNPAWRPELPY
jgi:hypothetical protein